MTAREVNRAHEPRLRDEVDSWIGTPHRLGGTTRDGVDCSGLTQSIYRSVYRKSLPRTTKEQIRVGKKVPPGALRSGDLLFFRTDGSSASKTNHVGIYLGGGEFVHASSSQGVTISRFDSDYWGSSFTEARRVIR